MTYQEFDQFLLEIARNLPTPRMDRAAQSTAQAAGGAASQAGQRAGVTSGQLLGQASGIFGNVVPFAENQLTSPQGFGGAYAGMLGQAGAVGSGVTASQEQQAAQRAANTGNIAGLSATQESIAQGAARGVGQNIQDLAVQNQLLKNQQQQQAMSALQGIYGTTLGGGLTSNEQAIQAANAMSGAAQARAEAGKSGWVQNLTGILGAVGGLGRYAPTGGVGGIAGLSLGGCHVAAELYGGWFSAETIKLRNFIFSTWWMAPFADLYSRIGPVWAKQIQTDRARRAEAKQLFDRFLSYA